MIYSTPFRIRHGSSRAPRRAPPTIMQPLHARYGGIAPKNSTDLVVSAAYERGPTGAASGQDADPGSGLGIIAHQLVVDRINQRFKARINDVG